MAAPARVHKWLRADGSLAFEHYKTAQGEWRYRHPAAGGHCGDHGGKAVRGRWCFRKPADFDGLLWEMPRLATVLAAGGDVLWASGEKDADAVNAYLDEAGVPPLAALATTVHHGENTPVTEAEADLFAGFTGQVILYFDRDLTGLRHALDRFRKLRARGVRVIIKAIPGDLVAGQGEPGDISDYLAAGGSLADFERVKAVTIREAIEEMTGHPETAARRSAMPDGDHNGDIDDAAAAEQLASFVAALRDADPGLQARRSGDRTYYTCPLADELHAGGDSHPSFNVRPGERGGLVLACSCPGGADTGEPHTEWAGRVLDKLGLDWDALSPPGEVTVGSEFPRNDIGNALLLRSLHGGDMAWVPEWKEWSAWDGHRWTTHPPVVTAMVDDMIGARHAEARAISDPKGKQVARSWAVSCGNDAKISAMLRRLSEMDGMIAPAASFDARPEIIQFSNGTLELEDSGVHFRETSKDDRGSAVVRASYRPQARSRHWEQFLRRFVPGKANREYLQALCGYSLLGENNQRKLIFVVGPTSTGKTTFINILQAALGSALSGTFQLSMFRTRRDDAPRPDILKAMTRRIVFAEEASSEWNLHADNIKQLTSHGRIEARGMRSNAFIERVPAFTPWIATNELPEVKHADSATKKRLIAFPFRQQVTLDDDDSDWITRLSEADLEAVLAWMVKGWEIYRERGLETMPPEVSEATQELREALSPIDIFLADRCEAAPGEGIYGGELYDHFEIWWEHEGHRRGEILTRSAFGRALTDRGYEAKHTNRGSLRMGLKMRETPS